MPPDPATLAAAAAAAAAPAADSDGANGADEVDAPAPAVSPGDVNGGRQTRRRWRLLQYILGWMEDAALEGSVGGVGVGGSGGASPEAEEALAAAAVALVAVTCPGPPASEEGAAAAARRRRRRPFLIETGDAPCPISADSVVSSGSGGDQGGDDGSGAGTAIADGVWGGALDNLGPFLRYGEEGAARSGWAAATARAVWGYDAAGCSARGGGDAELPAYVGFMAPTLRECGAPNLYFYFFSCFFTFPVSALNASPPFAD